MSYFLHIETSTTVCSVALSSHNKIVAYKEIDAGYTHAENLHTFIADLLKEQGLKTIDLAAVAVSKGPGSYTGLRIGVSAAKGLCFALNIPLLSMDTLEIMALQAKEKVNDVYFCPMLDARRMEVYTCLLDKEMKTIRKTEALIVNESSIEIYKQYNQVVFFGDGMPKCKTHLSALKNALFIENIKPSAKEMVETVFKKFNKKEFENLAYFEPFYLKDFLILKKST